jgi:splicing factor 3B subunit 4
LIVNVHQPKDRVTINHQGYGFVEFLTEEDADYAIKIMNMIKLYGKPIRVNKVNKKTRFRNILLNSYLGISTSKESGCWCEFIYW